MVTAVERIEVGNAVRRLRRRRWLRRALAGVFALATAVAGLLGFIALVSLIDEGWSDEGFARLLFPAAALVLWLTWRKLRAARRPHVLYLRGFHRVGTEDVVTFCATGAMGGDYRLVTLDDATLPPVGIPRRARRRVIAIGILGLIFLIVAFPLGSWMAESAVRAGVEGGFEAGASSVEGNALQRAILGIFAGLITAIIFGLIFGMFALIPAVLLGMWGIQVALLSVGSAFSIRRAEKRKRSTVESLEDLSRLRDALRRTERKPFSPRLLVVRVRDAVWKDVVEELGSDCVAALMDVSHLSEGLYWEAVHFRRRQPRPCVFVAEREAFEEWFDDDDIPLGTQFRELLEGARVILFSADSARAERSFATTLRTALDELHA